MKKVTYTTTAQKGLRKIGSQAAKRVVVKIEAYAETSETQANNVKKLVGEDNLYRLRVSDWRVIFTEDMTVLMILQVGQRKDAYR